ncbi:MAG TPA: tyrosine-type recombinase/integrase [Ktedonosporobacter sp.]|nr:tyrosine-type recombinase/integrase [Ktedonosporobacter sp.]
MQEKRRKTHRPHQMKMPGSSQTLQSFLDYWLRVRKTTIKPTTYVSYRSCVTKYIQPALGHVPLRQLTGEQIQAFYALQQSTGSPNLVRFIHTVFHQVLADAVIWKRLTINPCRKVEPPSSTPAQMDVLSSEQAHELLDATRKAHLDALLLLIITTGVRRRDLLALRWQQIDFQARCLRIEQGMVVCLAENASEPGASEPGLAPVQRIVPLPASAIHALKEHRQHQEELRQQVGEQWQEHQLVFPNTVGKYLGATAFHSLFKRILEQAGLPTSIRLHDLRHSATTLLQALEDHSKSTAWGAMLHECDQPPDEEEEGR